MIKKILFKILTGNLGEIIGPNNLVRAGDFISRAGRMDVRNDIHQNGEILIQETVLKQTNSKNLVIIDCGANTGQWAVQLVSTVTKLDEEKRLKVYCFEPSSYTFECLCKTLQKSQCGQVNFIQCQKALSSRSGYIDLNIVHEGAGTNSLVGVPGRSYARTELVEVSTLDAFAQQQNLAYIDLLKIDAEGHDFDVILGAEKLVNHAQIGVIQFEYNWRWIYGKHFLWEAFQFFQKRGYILGKVTPKGIQFYPDYDVSLESFVEGNYIACTASWRIHFATIPSWLELKKAQISLEKSTE